MGLRICESEGGFVPPGLADCAISDVVRAAADPNLCANRILRWSFDAQSGARDTISEARDQAIELPDFGAGRACAMPVAVSQAEAIARVATW